MLIFQIALGIVLAVIILALLPYIVVAGFWVIVAALAVAIVAALIFSDAGQIVAVVAIALAGVAWMVKKQDQNIDEETSSPGVGPTVIGRYCARCNTTFQSPECPTCQMTDS